MNFFSAVGTRIRASDPHHLAIMKGMLTVASFVFIGKLMSAMKEMAVAYRYGLAAEVDAYQFLYTLITWPTSIWATVLTAVLVPLAARMQESGSEVNPLPRFRAELLGLALLAGVMLALIAWLVIHVMLASGYSGLPARSVHFAEAALPGMSLLLPLGILAALYSAWTLSAGRHLNTLLECVPAFFIAGLVITFPHGGIQPLVWGTVIGCACQLLALMAPLAQRGEIEAPRFFMGSPQWRLFWQGFGIMLAGQALLSLTTVIDQFYAVGLGTGAIASLGYANRILSLILGLAAIAASRATLPIFSQMGKQDAPFRYLASYWARLLFVAGLLVTLVSYMLSPWAVKMLFQHGQFSAADTARVAEVLRYGLPQLPFYFSAMVLVSYALSQRRYALIFWSGVIGFAGKVTGNLLLVPLLGVDGIALAAIFVYGLNAIFFWLTLIARQPRDKAAAGSRAPAFTRWFN